MAIQLQEGTYAGAPYHLLRIQGGTVRPYRTHATYGQPLSQMDRFTKADASLNGTFFDMQNPSKVIYGEIKNETESYRPDMIKKRTYWAVTADGRQVMEQTVPYREDSEGVHFHIPVQKWDSFKYVMGGGGCLLRQGQPASTGAGLNDEQFQGDVLARRNRSAVGFNANEFLMVACDPPGWTPQETAAFLQARGATEAMMLDGGGSTEMILAHQLKTRLSAGQERSLPTALVVT